jgi:hypothetical protein
MKATTLIKIPVLIFFVSQTAYAQYQSKNDTSRKDKYNSNKGYNAGKDASGKTYNNKDKTGNKGNYNYPGGKDTGRTKDRYNSNGSNYQNKNDSTGNMKNGNSSKNQYQRGQKTKRDTTNK